MLNLRKAWLLFRAIPKTIYFNFYYFPFKQAIRLPVAISHHVILREMKGKVILGNPMRTASVRIGFGEHFFFNDYTLTSTWNVTKTAVVEFKGSALIGNGTRFFVGGKLTLGDNLIITSSTKFQCFEEINIGNNALIGWECIFMDSDGHAVLDENKQIINSNKAIVIGDNVWFGAKVFIAKGVKLGSNMIVAANSVVLKSFELPNNIIGGYPAKVLKTGVSWRG